MEFMEGMQKRAVKAASISDFIQKYHIRDRLYREEFDMLVQSYKEELEKYGYVLIPAHISTTGNMITYFPASKNL
jgi:hypothetical protein